jgi:Immunoglobulin-like domain of bacterial spore germination/Sporulation and spore germination
VLRRVLLVLLVLALALLPTACGNGKTQAAVTTATSTTAMPVETIVIRAYFVRDGKLAAVGRKTVHTLAVGQASIGALVTRPTAAERKIGFTTALPAGIELRKIGKDGKRLTLALTRRINRTAEAQVVTTLTQFASVHDVVLVTPAGRTPPLTRADFEKLMPAVLVETPTPFAIVKSPLEVSGSSNTFEATSQLELLGAGGKLIASKTVTASSGTGERGSFHVTLRFKAPAGPATLVSYEESAKDGSRIDVVRIPVRISD